MSVLRRSVNSFRTSSNKTKIFSLKDEFREALMLTGRKISIEISKNPIPYYFEFRTAVTIDDVKAMSTINSSKMLFYFHHKYFGKIICIGR